MKPFLACACLVLVSGSLSAQSFGARNKAMGGTGVASSHYKDAGFTNPALLTRFSADSDVAVVLPFISFVGSDEDELVDGLEDFQDTLEQVQDFLDMGDPASANALRPTLAQQLQDLDGRSADILFDGGFSVAIPSDNLGIALVGRSYVDGQLFPAIDANDVTVILDPGSTSADLDNLGSEAVAVAAGILEVGLAVAHEFKLLGRPLSVGVTPKFQRIETYNYAISVQDFDDDDALDDFDDDVYRDDETIFNVDAGVAFEPIPTVTVGLAGRNLISDEFDTVVTNGRAFTYELDPAVTLGAAFSTGLFTVTADVDLTETSGFDGNDGSRFVRGGVELNAFNWGQLWGGYFHDLEDERTDLFSAGVGIAPFGVVHLDLVGLLGEDSAGAAFQLSVTL